MKNIIRRTIGVLLIAVCLCTLCVNNIYAKAEDGSLKVTVMLKITAQDTMSGLDEMMISNYSDFRDGVWEKYAEEKEWTLLNNSGVNEVFIKVKDKYNNVSEPFKATIDLSGSEIFSQIKIDIIENKENSMLLKINLPVNEELTEMRFSSDNKAFTDWEKYNTVKNYNYDDAKAGKNILYISIKDVDNITYTKGITIDKPVLVKPTPADKPKSDDLITKGTVQISKPHSKKTLTYVKGVIITNKSDAVAGRVLGERFGIPVIITGMSARETKNAVDYVSKNVSKKVNIYALGLGKAVPNSLEGLLKKKGYSKIIRIGGEDKYETAEKISRYFITSKPNSIIILSGEKNVLYIEDVIKTAMKKKYPIVYSKKGSIPSSTKKAILALKPKTIYIVGNTSEVSDKVIKDIKKIKNVNIIRIKVKTKLNSIK